jgi:hypothetical protein
MTDDETTKLMVRYGITATQQTVYHYQGCRYGNLTDALNYAELLTNRTSQSPASAHRVDSGRSR